MDADLDRRILAALEREGASYVVFGGVALNLHGLARATRDLDLFIEPSAANVERIRAALKSVFADPDIDLITSEDLAGDYPAVAYIPPGGDFSIDLVARLGEAFRWEDIESMRLDWDGLAVQVVTPRMLHRMKRDTVRLQDRADAERLRAHFDVED